METYLLTIVQNSFDDVAHIANVSSDSVLGITLSMLYVFSGSTTCTSSAKVGYSSWFRNSSLSSMSLLAPQTKSSTVKQGPILCVTIESSI
jgi:hypothetical protein